jgi:hypothetical protein
MLDTGYSIQRERLHPSINGLDLRENDEKSCFEKGLKTAKSLWDKGQKKLRILENGKKHLRAFD